MKTIPLRIRITLLVMVVTSLMVLFFVVLGGVASIDEDFAVGSFESTSKALTQTDERLLEYSEDLQTRIVEWYEADGGEPFQDWNETDGVRNLEVLDEGGRSTDLISEGQVAIVGISRCQATSESIDCQNEDEGSGPVWWAIDDVEQRAVAASQESPVVVHGIIVRKFAGDVVLVRFESDVFAADQNISSGLEDLALVALPLFLVILGAITWFSLGRALTPVQGMIDQVDGIGADSLDQRVPVPEADDELKNLATTMNRMLDRLQRANDSQRQFISDASHELRSPITATGATIEVAKSDPDNANWHEVADVVEQENDRLARLVDDLLILARMDEQSGSGVKGEPWTVDLEEICLAEAERPHPIDVSVQVVTPARVTGSVSALSRAIRNLVDNAAAHAESEVRITVGVFDGVAVVRVLDDGPGVPPEFASQIFERFVRLDESRARSGSGNGTGGAGLGLAIARQIATNHGGRLNLNVNTDGGAMFDLTLPLA